MAVVRAYRTHDRRRRAEQHDDGRWRLYLHGHLVPQRVSLDHVTQRLADDGVDPNELVED